MVDHFLDDQETMMTLGEEFMYMAMNKVTLLLIRQEYTCCNCAVIKGPESLLIDIHINKVYLLAMGNLPDYRKGLIEKLEESRLSLNQTIKFERKKDTL